MIKIKKIIGLLSSVCSLINLTSCSEAAKTKLNSGNILKKYGENVYNALIEHDTESLKSMFCEELQNNYDIDSDIDAVYRFLGDNIQDYDNISCDTHGESIRDGETVRLTSYAKINGLKTDKDSFEITINVMLIYKDNPSYVGIQNIYITNSKWHARSDDYLDNERQIGDALEGW